ncbi:prolipoprotein diacylglyceryl transferase [Nitrospirales bacterium NOB]|nr:MAG: prolipoprotein diacylglyceryl transferase [Nitrospira sp. OLB3]MBV6470979.1 Prolipoprotein diacylglyceryl transferase [Nitrospirota bacterium]MCE7965716.1 prolipoprotein diacylglyceryl transferase [Nitrospira sp. NTP2]MCK6493105.1 prolipoprotein diacylglyceryl transferase [Nitrospira sp.]MDL1888520.1 prolipoprotein diacylglyceryl transferase [Nitrospirales bacterium NOB]MEB2340184.1 prolipoprotein diacylglyceryl transferase [Nitrospirales bacterium]
MLSWFRTIPYPDIDPVFLRLGPLQFRWYGLMYLIGLTLAYFIILARARAQKLPMDKDQVYDMIVYAAVGVFAGGRLGYVLFYNLSYYLENPLKIFAVWEGGMSFHGGLIGTIIALVLFARRQGITILTIADLAAGVTPVGLGLGRIGNFINGELYGRPTDVDWCMVFPAGGPACRHPSQLYESLLEGLLLFTVLWLLTRRLPPPGTIFGAFLVGYGLCRIVVEFFREPDAQIGFLFGSISMGQLLSLPMIVAGTVILAVAFQRKKPFRSETATGERRP